MRTDSVASGRSNKNTYRVRSRTSDVDETLFSSPTKDSLIKRQQAPRARETVTVITKDLIRNVIVPSKDPSGQSVVLQRNSFNRIKHASKVRSKLDIEQEAKNRQQKKEENMSAAADRKAKFQELDLDRQQNDGLNDLEEEAKKENEHLLEKARSLRMEQEDEIKRLNELMLNAKCHAIRDVQIKERDEIHKDLQNEDKRLDVIMEVHRVNGVKESEMVEEIKQRQRKEGARQILEQIKYNTENRLLDDERKNAEAQALVEYMDKLQNEDMRELQERRNQQLQLQFEIDEINRQAQFQKEKRANQENIQDQKIVEYNRIKEEREAEFEAEQIAAKAAKEREIQRLRSLQERAQDHQAEQDALRAKRNQEQNEREWRRKERSAAEHKLKLDAEMKQAREDQINHKMHFQAIQAQRERHEFDRVLREQEREIKMEKHEKVTKDAELTVHAKQLRQQINENERCRIQERRDFFAQSEEIDANQAEHSKKLQEVIDKKLDELRQAGIDEKYINEVTRQIHQPKRLTN